MKYSWGYNLSYHKGIPHTGKTNQLAMDNQHV